MLRKIYNYLKRRSEMVSGFKKNARYFSQGKYIFNDTINILLKNDSFTKTRMNELLQINYYYNSIYRLIAWIFKRIFYRKGITVSNDHKRLKGFTGTVYLPVGSTKGYSDIRIFDFTNNKVLTILTNKNDYFKLIGNYDHFKEHFPIPSILWTNEEELLIMEELVIYQPINNWVEDDFSYVMRETFKRYHEYFNFCKTKGMYTFQTPFELFNSLPEDAQVDLIKKEINSELLELKAPFIKLHGDLWTSNILLIKVGEEKQLKYIDWEWSSDFLFFYDVFMMMWNEVVIRNNYLYIEKYVKGEYDDYFSGIFSIFNLDFQPQYRLDYLNIFFINLYKEKMLHLDKKETSTIFEQYNRLQEKMEGRNGVSYIKEFNPS